jgi:hypothetical protein
VVVNQPLAGGGKGDRLLFSIVVTSDDVIEPAHAENSTWAARRFCLSSDQSRKWSRDYLS